MKNLKNTLKITSIFILLAATLSCSNIFSKKLSQSEPNKTILKVNVQDTSVGRTVFPSNDVSILSDFTVTCERSGFTSKTKTAADSQALNALVFEFEDGEEGSWDISIEGSYKIGSGTSEQTLTFSDTKTVNVQKNMLNSVTFALKNSDYSYGGLNITVNFEDTTAAVSTVFLALQTQIMSGQPLDQKEYTIFDTTANGKSFTYSRDISDALERLGEGTYILNLVFFAEDNSFLNYLSIGVRIVNGLTTSKTLNIAVNQIYDAEYEFYAGDTKLNVAAGQTFPEGVEIDGASVLPLRYSTQGTDLPKLKLQDYGFDGWYDAPTGGNLVTKLSGFPASGTSKKVYARFFKPEVIVSSDSSVNPDYTTIDDAIEYISQFAKAHNSKNIDWKIKVRGTLKGMQMVNNNAIDYNDNFEIDHNAASVTIEGYTTPVEGSDPTDSIDAELTTPTNIGVVLDITAGTPIILKNIKITGGYNNNIESYPKGGGVYIGPGTNVTFGDGVLITGNSAPEGSGIYAAANFTMCGSALVASGNDIYLKKDSDGIKTITISSSLTKASSSNKMKVTPGAYQNDAPLMYVDFDLGFTPDQSAAEFEKFEVTQPEGAAFTCRITSTGRLAKYDSSADGNYYADLGLPSGTLWSVKNWGETDSVPGKQYSYWHNFTYGDNGYSSEPVWGEEWDIASTEEWQELIDSCYWKGPYNLKTSGGNNYSAYYVFEAKDTEDKGTVGTKDIYDQDKDVCIKITQSAYNKAVVYWPQTFVEASNENIGAANYTPKPTKIDMSGIAPVLTNTWTSASEQYQYYRLVISKKKTLVVTESGGSDTNSGRNAKDALTSIQGALDKIYATESSFEDPSAIDWEILYYGELTTGQQFATYNSLSLNSLTVYSITGTGSEATKSIWVFDSQGNLKHPVVTFISNGGTAVSSQTIENSLTATEPTAPEKTGFEFKGWFTDEDLTKPFSFSTPITSDITLYAKFNPVVGSILMTDGKFISSSEITTENAGNIVGVVFALDENGIAKTVLGIRNSESTTFKWANSTTNQDKKITAIICTPSANNLGDTTTTFSGDADGSDNWGKIEEVVSGAVVSDFPAFEYAFNYGTSSNGAPELSTTNYKDKWYLPSIAELADIVRNKEILNQVLTIINNLDGFTANIVFNGEDGSYWSSSQSNSGNGYAYSVNFSGYLVSTSGYTKSSLKSACAVHSVAY